MFFRRRGTIIAQGLNIKSSGLVEVNGNIEGDVHCASLFVSPKAVIIGGVEANRVVVSGRVEGPIRGSEVVLKSHAHVVGDIHHQSLSIEPGAYFEGRSVCTAGKKLPARPFRETELRATREPVDASVQPAGREGIPLNLTLAENENECPARGVPGVESTNGKGVRLRG